jgi:hypothetical protein
MFVAVINQKNKKMNYFSVTNRNTRKQQILNTNEILLFFKKNNIKEYAVRETLSPTAKKYDTILNTIAVSFFSVAFVILISDLIFNLIK